MNEPWAPRMVPCPLSTLLLLLLLLLLEEDGGINGAGVEGSIGLRVSVGMAMLLMLLLGIENDDDDACTGDNDDCIRIRDLVAS